MMRQYELVEKVLAYDPQADEQLLNKAYIYGYKKHGTQKRASGDPYFSHPIEVAAILAELKLDSTVVATGLLHDTIEDTDATRAEIDQLFGEEIGSLVEGLTKISQLNLISREVAQSENLRKLFFAISKDIRVLLVKLADRMHNMRTIMHVKPEKRQRIAQETMDFYAPLAGRMGIHFFREELEDICFQVLNHEARDTILNRLQEMHEDEKDLLDDIAEILNKKLKQAGIVARVYGREKRPYSIFRKMERQSISLEKISDIFAFRIITNSEDDCYRALGLVHTEWPMVPERFKDFISIPKSNDYRSIHTTIIGPTRKRIELQIRTEEMQEVNEFGIASHALYKEDIYINNPKNSSIPGKDAHKKSRSGSVPVSEESSAFKWLRHVIESLEDGDTPAEFLENTKLELFADQAFCFTPNGRLIALPKHATPIDFAYAVHTDIGNTCVGCKINGVTSPLRSKLDNGDEVEIVTSKGSKPQAIWESFVTTGKAKSAIRRANKEERQKQYSHLGREMLNRIFKRLKIKFTEDKLTAALPKIAYKSLDDVFVAIARSEIKLKDVATAMVPMLLERNDIEFMHDQTHFEIGASNKTTPMPIRGVSKDIGAIRFSKKHPPIAGERIVGILRPAEGLVVYPIHSEELEAFEDNPELWIDLVWDLEGREKQWFTAPIEITLLNEVGALAQITTMIAEQGCNIWNSYIVAKEVDFHHLYMEIEVRDIHHFNLVKNSLKTLPIINDIKRVAGKKFGEISI
ncbi:MAG: bifunctional (p)ppGpp synthetase/guanosine-3',5'-bis(diphosphate) 3'-pyrophosphohydrolase [Hyphomicrobiales bacterium]|nr:MAG: bifunctional (p)ppGpp synthetase/guanosine-3',5'-bis(diphosphate) 3'-pyrophosphohydrolase [Hyphomicrobiales bacterium]